MSVNITDIKFDSMIGKSYGFDPNVYYDSPEWKIIKQLYLTNYIQNKSVEQKIPKKIHQIWLGGKLPEQYKKYTETWKKFHPDWEYKLWTDRDVDSIFITKRDVFNQASSQGMRSDILRYEILRKIGGLYVDTDFECLKPFDDLLNLDFFTGIGYDTQLQLYIGLIACPANHPIMNDCVHVASFYSGVKGSVIVDVTGANHFTKCFLKNPSGVAFPMDFFYPFPNNMRDKDDPYKYITENSYAIHHWAVSWIKKKV